jgi:hypothetical protein
VVSAGLGAGGARVAAAAAGLRRRPALADGLTSP